MSDVVTRLAPPQGAEGRRCLARVAAFDAEQEPVLRSSRGPWANTESPAPEADAQLAAWLRSAAGAGAPAGYSPRRGWVPGTPVDLALAVGALVGRPGPDGEREELGRLLGTAAPETPLEHAAVAWARRRTGAATDPGPPPPLPSNERPWPAAMFVIDRELGRARNSGARGGLDGLGDLIDLLHRAGVDHGDTAFSRSLYVSAYAAAVLDREDTFLAAHATAESVLGLFEMRKHAFGLTGAVTAPANLRDLCLVRSVWRLLAQVVGDHRFLNGALKLAEWMRGTLLPAARGETPGTLPWHGMRLEFPEGEDPFFSTEVAALHLLAAAGEARMVAELAGRGSDDV